MLSKISVGNPISLPVDLERAKQRLHIETNDYDIDLNSLLLAATAAVEHHTGRALFPSVWEWRRDCWPGCYPIEIPLAPIRDVTEVAYLDDLNDEQTVDDANWDWRRTPSGAELWFTSGYSYPTLYDQRGRDRVIVRVSAGYDDPTASGAGDDPELEIDPRLEMAVLFLVSTWFERREHASADQLFEVPDTFKFLANQLRIFR